MKTLAPRRDDKPPVPNHGQSPISRRTPDIAAATIHAHNRGVDVQLIMDTEQSDSKGSLAADLLKYIIIDDATVVTGSFNFTRHASRAQQRYVKTGPLSSCPGWK